MCLVTLTKSQVSLWAFLLGIMGGSVLVDLILLRGKDGIHVHAMLRREFVAPVVATPVSRDDSSVKKPTPHVESVRREMAPRSTDAIVAQVNEPKAEPQPKEVEPNPTDDMIDTKGNDASLFRPFPKSPELHNTTVSGLPLPGMFYSRRLFLFGSRLTTSYETDNQGVQVDLFGFPGDWFTRKARESDSEALCPSKDPSEGHFMKYNEFVHNNTMYCQLECDLKEKCGKKVPMQLVPLKSGDPNQADTTLIWRCDVSHLVKKKEFVEESKRSDSSALRVSFFISHRDTDSPRAAHSITEVDIPLRTAVAGHAGPQIVGKAGSYFLQPGFKVGLMTATFGMRGQKHLAEFVQHHLNTGFQQIVVGVESTLDSPEMHATKEALAPYVEQGTVLLAATGHQKYFECDSDFPKLHFYHQTLYHFKGLTPYSATWDIDEFWVPPARQNGAIANQSKMHASSESFISIVTEDKLWQSSRYAKSASIGSVIENINLYYENDDMCGSEWCFHLFPSYTVHLLDGKDPSGNDGSRINRHVFDFGRRDEKPNLTWQKSITRTKIAHMGGMHFPGSCKFNMDSTEYFEVSDKGQCTSRAEAPKRFGEMHHFFNLMMHRGYPLKDFMGELPPDEYITQYGVTIAQQLDAVFKTALVSST